MDATARVDYFRSEVKGELEKLVKQMAENHASLEKKIHAVEEQQQRLWAALRNAEMSVR